MKDRRTIEGYKLRVYIDQIKIVEAMSDEEWIDQWVKSATPDSVYLSRVSWLSFLRSCVISEVNLMLKKEAA